MRKVWLQSLLVPSKDIQFMRLNNNTRLCSSNNDLFNYKSKYNLEEETQIFKFLNDSSNEDIMKLSMSQQRLKRLLSKRSSKGVFNNFSDILTIDGLGIKIMEKMCDSILNFDANSSNISVVKKKNRFKGQFLQPILGHTQHEKINSALGIFTNVNYFGWARIEKNNYTVTDWELYDIRNDTNKKLPLTSIMEIIWKVYTSLPESDIYVMEAEPTILRSVGADANNPRMMHVNLQKAQMVAMLSAAINVGKNIQNSSGDTSDEVEQFSHNVFYLRSVLPSRLFKTLIGTERVSAQTAVVNLMNGINPFDLNKKLTFEMDIREHYNSQNDIEKEMLAQTLLIALTFFELCLFKNISAIEKLNNFND